MKTVTKQKGGVFLRVLQIIEELEDANDYLSIEYFMEKNAVARRTIQKDFSYLTNVAHSKGFKLIQKRGKGYLLEVVDKCRFYKYIDELRAMDIKSGISVENIIGYVALHEGFIPREQLVDVLETSLSQIKNYKEYIDHYLENYNLAMERKSHYGVRINKSMVHRRKLLVDFYLKDNKIVKEAIDYAMKGRFTVVEKLLIENLKEKNFNINYVELNEVIAWVKVIIYVNIELQTPMNNSICPAVKVIEDKFGIGIPEADIENLMELVKRKARNSKNAAENMGELPKDICNFLQQIDEENNTSFNLDDDFKQLLTIHIASLINRLKFKISYTNPIVDELSIKYPMIFNIAISLGEMLNEKYGIEPTIDEIGFITTHFAVHMEREIENKLRRYNRIAIVCSSGGGSAYLIKLKIKGLFEKAQIETFSMLQMKELQEFRPDIVFSTIDFTKDIEAPLIYINELLDDYDVLKIKQLVMFNKVNGTSIDKAKDYYIETFFDSRYFSIEDKNRNYIDCITEMSETIEKDHIGGDNYRNYVLKREEFSSTVYNNGVAIPHPIEMKANKNLVAIKVFKNPIIFNNKKVSIIFMICLRKDSLEFNREITKDLFEIMNDTKMVQGLVKANSFKEFIALINKKVGD